MQAFLPFVAVPVVLVGIVSAGAWLSEKSLPPPQPVVLPKAVQLPPNVQELLTAIGVEEAPPLRLAALMPSAVIDRVLPPPPPPPSTKSAAERHRLVSTLLAEGVRPSAVIDDRVVLEGESIGEYRLARVAADHVVLAGPRGRERVGLDGPPALLARADAASASKSPGAPLPPAPDAATLERQFRRLLENLGH